MTLSRTLLLWSSLSTALLFSACATSHAPGSDGSVSGDVGRPADAGPYVPSCAPMDARVDPCAVAVCAPVTGAFWDGAACVPVHCNCAGAECGVYTTLDACEADHAACDATLCTTTGGAWFARAEWCGHFQCGFPPSVLCDESVPACDCGLGRVFQDGAGCVDGALCELTEMLEPEAFCTATGGTWRLDVCGHATCGRLSDADCILPGCVCGDLEVFDPQRGCVRSPTCELRQLGEPCTDTGLCADSVCCVNGGISADATCVAPLCDDPHGVCGPPRS